MSTTNSTARRIYDSPDLTYIEPGAQTQKSIPNSTHEIHKHVSTLSDTPVHSFLDELLGLTKRTSDIFFEPPPGHNRRANGCFRLAILPTINTILFELEGIDKSLVELHNEIQTLEKSFSDIHSFILRFCKG